MGRVRKLVSFGNRRNCHRRGKYLLSLVAGGPRQNTGEDPKSKDFDRAPKSRRPGLLGISASRDRRSWAAFLSETYRGGAPLFGMRVWPGISIPRTGQILRAVK